MDERWVGVVALASWLHSEVYCHHEMLWQGLFAGILFACQGEAQYPKIASPGVLFPQKLWFSGSGRGQEEGGRICRRVSSAVLGPIAHFTTGCAVARVILHPKLLLGTSVALRVMFTVAATIMAVATTTRTAVRLLQSVLHNAAIWLIFEGLALLFAALSYSLFLGVYLKDLLFSASRWSAASALMLGLNHASRV
jgi:hypothetical protein